MADDQDSPHVQDNEETYLDEEEDANKPTIIYKLEEVPSILVTIGLGLQHYLTMFGSTVSIPFVLAAPLCIGNNPLAISDLISTIFFVSGISTLLQSVFGIRLPIVQGGTFALVTPTIAIMSLDKWKLSCSPNVVPFDNLTVAQQAIQTEMWQSRMREIQGSIIISSFFQVVIGFTGLMGLCLRFIGPLTIAPTIALVGLALIDAAKFYASSHWGMAILTITLIVLFSQYLERFAIPLPVYNKEKKCHIGWIHVFRLFPVLLAIIVAWCISAIITAAGGFPDDQNAPAYRARTDARGSVLINSPWIRFPYPFQWGLPTVSVAGVFGMLAGVLASMIESLGDYYACARLAGTRPPPQHAVNRGIAIEGIGSILAGMIGSGNGTTSYSENVGAIGITKVASRAVVQCGAILMIILGILSKFGALFSTIPDPVIGGVFIVMFGMITAVGLSNLQFCNMNSSRNIFITGFSIIFGLVFPSWLATGNNAESIDTTVPELNQIIVVLLSTSMAVGGILAFILDNTIPGTLEERGMHVWLKEAGSNSARDKRIQAEIRRVYDLPFGLTKFFHKASCTRYLPFCPPRHEDDDVHVAVGKNADMEAGAVGDDQL
ncbi:Solute carrier family 23 member 2 [Trichoplax sp. H2]|nr:Solute carrier family 23 member 2 [Trichoplax sp. H2]|eukprot:RDD39403.1 Solute carrier family 23 member 2 [Trichoplax sp. H2]